MTPEIGGHELTEPYLHQIAGHQIGHGDGLSAAVTDHRGAVLNSIVHHLSGPLGAVRVEHAEADRRGQDEADDHGVGPLAEEERCGGGCRKQQ
ncbi:hypothetical protein [Nocardia sp. NPDC049149]|uniref:hypothetical protein n=1 Tax=Nocardia sp. NPDC049149 TaxID=3364315 RepID=UPI00371C810F